MRVIILFLLLGCAAPLSAQQRLGFKVGTNVSNYQADAFSNEFDSKAGLVAGVMLRQQVTERLLFLPEILYTVKGAQGSGQIRSGDDIEPIPVEFVFDTIYLEIPLLVGVQPFPDPVLGFDVYGGLTPAFLLDSATTLSARGQEGSPLPTTSDCANSTS